MVVFTCYQFCDSDVGKTFYNRAACSCRSGWYFTCHSTPIALTKVKYPRKGVLTLAGSCLQEDNRRAEAKIV